MIFGSFYFSLLMLSSCLQGYTREKRKREILAISLLKQYFIFGTSVQYFYHVSANWGNDEYEPMNMC